MSSGGHLGVFCSGLVGDFDGGLVVQLCLECSSLRFSGVGSSKSSSADCMVLSGSNSSAGFGVTVTESHCVGDMLPGCSSHASPISSSGIYSSWISLMVRCRSFWWFFFLIVVAAVVFKL